MAAEHAYLYVVGAADGPVKIGYSMVPAARLEALAKESGQKVFLAGEWPIDTRIAPAAERYVHWQLREHHIRREWFNVSQEIAVQTIQAALAKSTEFSEWDRVPALTGAGRKIRYAEQMQMRFPAGIFARIEAVLTEDEDRTDFVREAVARELKRREKQKRGGKRSR